jgi:hypothetical protein
MPRKKKEEEGQEQEVKEESGFLEQSPEPGVDEDIVIDTAAEPLEDESLSRADKKRQRGDRLVEESKAEAERYKAELEQRNRESQELRERLAKMEGRLESQSGGEDPIAAREKEIKKELRQIATNLAREGITQEDAESESDRAWGLQKELQGLWVRQHQAEAQKNQLPPPNPRQMMLQMQYADVFQNPRARDYYMQHYFTRKAELNLPPNQPVPENVLVESLEYARKMVGGGAPTDTEQRRMMGSPVGGADSTARSDTKVTMGPRQRMMADAAFKSIKDPEERYRLFAKRLAEKK